MAGLQGLILATLHIIRKGIPKATGRPLPASLCLPVSLCRRRECDWKHNQMSLPFCIHLVLLILKSTRSESHSPVPSGAQLGDSAPGPVWTRCHTRRRPGPAKHLQLHTHSPISLRVFAKEGVPNPRSQPPGAAQLYSSRVSSHGLALYPAVGRHCLS